MLAESCPSWTCVQTWFEKANGLHVYLLMQASCRPVTNDVRSISVGWRWVVKGNKNFRAHKSLRLVLATPFFKSWEKIKMFNDGTDPNAGIDKDYQNGFTATLNFPKMKVAWIFFNHFRCFFFYTCQNVKLGVLIRIRLKKVTWVILELQTHKSKLKGLWNGLFFCNGNRLRHKLAHQCLGICLIQLL